MFTVPQLKSGGLQKWTLRRRISATDGTSLHVCWILHLGQQQVQLTHCQLLLSSARKPVTTVSLQLLPVTQHWLW